MRVHLKVRSRNSVVCFSHVLEAEEWFAGSLWALEDLDCGLVDSQEPVMSVKAALVINLEREKRAAVNAEWNSCVWLLADGKAFACRAGQRGCCKGCGVGDYGPNGRG